MIDPQLADALDRAERALARIEEGAARATAPGESERVLREKVRSVVDELDELIGAAGGL